MIRAKVNRKASVAKPYLIWNAYVDVLAMSDLADLTPIQVPAHLAFCYDSEVQNGGHLQYFLNKGIEEAKAAADALPKIGANAQREILVDAIELYAHSNINDWETAEEYDAVLNRDDLQEHDMKYYGCVPEMTELLQQYLNAHTQDFVEFTDEPVRDR